MSAFSPPDSRSTFCSFLPGGDAMMSMPLSLTFSSSVRRISPEPPPNSVRKHCLKFSLMARKASEKRVPGELVDLLNRLLGVPNRIEQILALGGEEVLAELGFLELFEGREIDGAEVLDLRSGLLVRALGGLQDFDGIVLGGFEFGHAKVQALCGWFRRGIAGSDWRRVRSISISESGGRVRLRCGRATRGELHRRGQGLRAGGLLPRPFR